MKKLLLLFILTGFVYITNAQTTITGKIRDYANGETLVGVTILIKGKVQGTISDVDGNYLLEIEDNDSILIFSFIGYITQEIAILNQTLINVELKPDIINLDQVVVVGYGTQNKRDITGAVSTVDVEDLRKSHSLTITDQLQGRVAGVSVVTSGRPGSIGDIKIRGTSFFGGNNPLYVIDGVLTGDSPNLNPNDIETIQVLKDASSTAIYGNRAANGVIIITTKKGTRGKLKVNFNLTTGVQEIKSRIELVDNYGWARIINAAHDNANVPRQALADTEFNPNLNTDWQEEVFSKNALMYDANLSISGGGEHSMVFFSVNTNYQDGTIKGPDFNRISTRLNSEFDLHRKLKIGQHLTIGYAKTNGVSGATSDVIGPFSAAYEMLPVIPVYDTSQISGFGIGEIMRAQTWSENPIGVMELFTNFNENTRILGDVYLNYEIIDGFEYRLSLGLSTTFNRFKSYNESGQIRMATLQMSGLTESYSQDNGLFIENRLTYVKEIGKHSFSIMGTQTSQQDHGTIQSVTSVGGYDDEVNFWQISNSTGSISASGTEYYSNTLSFLSRGTYNYSKKYFLTAIIRADGSSKFSSENRWGVFPSVSGGWDIAKENFFKSNLLRQLKIRAGYGEVGNASIGDYQYTTVITRMAQGEDYWSAGVNYNLGPASQSVIGATRSDYINDPNITWEKLKEFNIGLDIEAFEGQLALNADYYFGNMDDLLAEVPAPTSVGATWPSYTTINAVSMKRNGWEFSASYRKLTGDFKYTITANLSHTSNEITELGYGLTDLTEGTTTARVGYELGRYYVLEYQGIYTQAEIDALPEDYTIAGNRPDVGDAKYNDVNGRDEDGNLTGLPDGKISLDDDRVFMGTPTPYLNYGLIFDFSYKIFDLTLFIQGISKRDVYNSYNELMTAGEWGHFTNYPTDFDPYIDGAGTDPRPYWDNGHGNNLPSSRFIENGAYMRLKNLQLGVTLPFKDFKGLRIFISGQNLLTFTKYKGLDPEFEGDLFSPGVDPRLYPSIRTFTFGIDLKI